VFAALVHHRKFSIFGDDDGMVTRDARIGDNYVFIYFPSNRERSVVNADGVLFPVLHQNQLWKQTGARLRGRFVSDVSGHGLIEMMTGVWLWGKSLIAASDSI